jgi:hypothetical protein
MLSVNAFDDDDVGFCVFMCIMFYGLNLQFYVDIMMYIETPSSRLRSRNDP